MNIEKTSAKLDEKIPQRYDSGYQGIQKGYPKHYIILPYKKSKFRQPLKDYNQTFRNIAAILNFKLRNFNLSS